MERVRERRAEPNFHPRSDDLFRGSELGWNFARHGWGKDVYTTKFILAKPVFSIRVPFMSESCQIMLCCVNQPSVMHPARGLILNGPVYRCHAISTIFRNFQINKNHLHSSVYYAEVSKSMKSQKNPLQIHNNVGPQPYKEMYAREQALLPGLRFFVKMGRSGAHLFKSLQWILMKLDIFIKSVHYVSQ